jgi:hypothetical protein
MNFDKIFKSNPDLQSVKKQQEELLSQYEEEKLFLFDLAFNSDIPDLAKSCICYILAEIELRKIQQEQKQEQVNVERFYDSPPIN